MDDEQVRKQIRWEVSKLVWQRVENRIWALTRSQVRDQVDNQVWDPVWALTKSQVAEQVSEQIKEDSDGSRD